MVQHRRATAGRNRGSWYALMLSSCSVVVFNGRDAFSRSVRSGLRTNTFAYLGHLEGGSDQTKGVDLGWLRTRTLRWPAHSRNAGQTGDYPDIG